MAKLYQKSAAASLFIKKNDTTNETVFFPGCALAAKSIELVEKIMDYLGDDVDLFTGCCGNPASQMNDHKEHDRIVTRLVKNLGDYKNIIIACPNCYTITKKNFPNANVKFIYSFLDPKDFKLSGEYDFHHPCPIKDFETRVEIEKFVSNVGIKIISSKGFCCGVKGMLKMLDFERYQQINKAANQFYKAPLTYCFECKENLDNSAHLLELLFDEEAKKVSFIGRWVNRYKISR
jgi:Fe-S oxidoreductase